MRIPTILTFAIVSTSISSCGEPPVYTLEGRESVVINGNECSLEEYQVEYSALQVGGLGIARLDDGVEHRVDCGDGIFTCGLNRTRDRCINDYRLSLRKRDNDNDDGGSSGYSPPG